MLIRSHVSEGAPSIELTPIIDMVFLLLIFFLVATTFREEEREMEIALPEAESGLPISVAMRELVVNIDSDGAVIVGRQRMDAEGLRTIVGDAIKANPKQKVTIRGDKDVPYGTVAQILGVCKAAGVSEPFLDTVPVR